MFLITQCKLNVFKSGLIHSIVHVFTNAYVLAREELRSRSNLVHTLQLHVNQKT